MYRGNRLVSLLVFLLVVFCGNVPKTTAHEDKKYVGQGGGLRDGGSWGGGGKAESLYGSRGRSSRNSNYNGTRGYHRIGAHKRLMPFLCPVFAIFCLLTALLCMVCGVCPAPLSMFNVHIQTAKRAVEASIAKCTKSGYKPIVGPPSGVYEAQYEENFRTFHSTSTIIFTPICDEEKRIVSYHLKGSGIDRDGTFEIVSGTAAPDGTAYWLEQLGTVEHTGTSCGDDQLPQQILIHGKFHLDRPVDNFTSFSGCWRSTNDTKGDFIWFKYKEGSSQDSPMGVRQQIGTFVPMADTGFTTDLLGKDEKDETDGRHTPNKKESSSSSTSSESSSSYKPPPPPTPPEC